MTPIHTGKNRRFFLFPPPPPPPILSRIKCHIRRPAILLAALTLALSVLAACSTSAAPSECVRAAEKAGLPESVIEQLKKPGDLNAIQRVALREVLEKAELDTICDQIN